MPLISEERLRRFWGTEQLHQMKHQAELVIGSLGTYIDRSSDIGLAISQAVDQEVPLYLNAADRLLFRGGDLSESADRIGRAFRYRSEALRYMREGIRREYQHHGSFTFVEAAADMARHSKVNPADWEMIATSAGKQPCRRTLTAVIRWMDDARQATLWTNAFNDVVQDIDKAITRQIQRRLTIFAVGAAAVFGIVGILISKADR